MRRFRGLESEPQALARDSDRELKPPKADYLKTLEAVGVSGSARGGLSVGVRIGAEI